jgi:hypothetical protein
LQNIGIENQLVICKFSLLPNSVDFLINWTMNIKKVKTAKKVGEFILRNDNHRNFIGFEYENNIQPILDNEDGRVEGQKF